MKQYDISIDGMSCAACVNRIERIVSKSPTVISVSVSLAANRAMLIANDDVDLDKIFKAISDAGFKPSLEAVVDNKKADRLKKRFLITLPFTIVIFLLSMGTMLIDIHVPYNEYIQLVFSAFVLLYGGSGFYIPAFKKPLHPDMNTLITLGTFTAFIYSTVLLILGHPYHDLYFESSSIIIIFLLLGRFLEHKAKKDVSESINALINLSPKTALVCAASKEIEKNISDIGLDDIIILKSGSIVATDGIITDGELTIDESMLTGESKPIKKTKGDEIFAGTTILNGSAQYRSTKLGKDTVLASITKAVLDASMQKASIERLADKIASIFTPIVLAVSVIVFAVWFFLTGNASFGVIPLVSILVIACPCALGLATPTAIIAAVGRAAKEGVLIRNGEVLEWTSKLDIMIFDKTGTLTYGDFKVTEVEMITPINTQKFYNILLSVEKKSEHLIAKAIVNYAIKNSASEITVDKYENSAGSGVVAEIDSKKILIGNEKHLTKNGVDISVAKESTRAGTLVYVAVDGKLIAKIFLGDTLREGAANLIEELKRLDVEPVILSGDNKLAVKETADKLNITRYYYEASPEDKMYLIEECQNQGKTTAMIGDGINDAIALSKADIGISLSSATDIAISSSDITVINNDISKILFSIKLAKKASFVIRENLFWAFIYNIIAIPIAAGVLYPTFSITLNPAIAGIAMAFSSVTVVSNSLRLKFFKADK